MPLLFYLPLIIWMGMVEIMQDELRVLRPYGFRRNDCSMPNSTITPARASFR
jgi:hypothetical protein